MEIHLNENEKDWLRKQYESVKFSYLEKATLTIYLYGNGQIRAFTLCVLNGLFETLPKGTYYIKELSFIEESKGE